MNIIDAMDNIISGSGKKTLGPRAVESVRKSVMNSFSIEKRNGLEAMFGGLDKKGVEAKIKWLRDNPSKAKQYFTPSEIDKIEELLTARF